MNNRANQNSAPSQDDGKRFIRTDNRNDAISLSSQDMTELDSGIKTNGILEVIPDGFRFIRCEDSPSDENDVYVAPSQIRRFNLKTGDIIVENREVKSATEKFAALPHIKTVNGYPLSATETRPNFEDLTSIFPNRRLYMEAPGERNMMATRVLGPLTLVRKGQHGTIVSPPKAGKATLPKQVTKAVTTSSPDIHLIILLVNKCPGEVTGMREAIVGPSVEIIYSTFDELSDRHKRVSEMMIERAKRPAKRRCDAIILLDSITKLARMYNLTVAPNDCTLSGGLDPTTLHIPKRSFGTARSMHEDGNLTILATALVEARSRIDDVAYGEFRDTDNAELVPDRRLSEKCIFPAIGTSRSGTRRDDLLLSGGGIETVDIIRKAIDSLRPEGAVERILDLFARTRNNREFVGNTKRIRSF